jgi:flavin reductase (DIM6/NTAB) family NADH-FMN oxidoreductase RutF
MKKEMAIREGLRCLPIRPIYLASVEHGGKKNIITIGMFGYFSGKPTIVGIGIAPSRYSYDLIHKSGEFVVNVVDEKLTSAVRICGEQSGRDVDKFLLAKLTPEKSVKVSAPQIGESPVSIECKVIKEIELGDHAWFMGEVLATSVREGYDWKEGLLFKWIGEDGFYYKVGKKIAEY